MDNKKRQLIKTLAHYGAVNAKLSKKQQMKLREWVLPYLMDEFGLGGQGPMSIKDMRKFIDNWEVDDLKEKDYKYYYVDKNSDGKSLWDLI
jgi:hypothetical protein